MSEKYADVSSTDELLGELAKIPRTSNATRGS
jgi:hypothetical protein